MQGDRYTEKDKRDSENLIENDSQHSMRAHTPNRVDHETIDNEQSESDDEKGI